VKTVAAVAAIAGGILLLVVPRFVFQTCEAIGRGRMHCTDLAHGEYVAGALLALAGALLLAFKPDAKAIAAAGAALLVSVAAFFMPALTRYCANPDMPCHYGMAPSVRFIAAASAVAQLAALASLLRSRARREP
jgi:hypothetical protein